MFDFIKLNPQFKGDIVTPEDADYPQAIARWAVNAERRAKVVAFVKDTDDVALAIKYARSNSLPIAIRGGGHSPGGASSSHDGLVIDLSRYLNGARVDPDKNVVYVGGGALWEAVDKEAIKYGLATVGGTVNHVSILNLSSYVDSKSTHRLALEGLYSRGGYGWLTPQHGLVIDNLVEATVVTADGSVLTASDTENPDLFFGIRGAGSNFGVVTEFVLKLYPQRATVYHGMLIFPPAALEKLLEVTTKWLANAGEKESMLQFLGIGPDGNNGMMYHGQAVYPKGSAHSKIHYPSIAQAYEKAISFSGPELQVHLLFDYFPLQKVMSVPPSATAFRRDPTPSFLVIALWKENSEENTARGREITHEIARIVAGGQVGLTEAQSFGYANYDQEVVTGEKELVLDKARTAFAENYPRLQAVKKRYDPDCVFNKWFAITPA
ncbi:hypothetical protein H0H81_010003 [Sphagnurus paluster]|uniref:FAD-binding PCMH-type domain-containing protein n=1 Tax=Sphagnurus paluster TaxID=117069 RepID=A0A9P7GJ95_9AGAR|nr:hypothetical protein H0H81_010003 [Sphagnurus paluster]